MTFCDIALAGTAVAMWTVATSEVVAESIQATKVLSDAALAWLCIGPGCLGGLAMQLLPDQMKSRRQLVGEILCSGGAAVLTVGFFRENVNDVFMLGGICFIAGASGSGLIIAWSRLLQGAGGRAIKAFFGSTEEDG